MKRTIQIAVAVVVAALVGFVLFTLNMAGVFQTIEPHGPRPLQMVEGFEGGTEDLAMVPDGSGAFVSSANFHEPSKGGRIYYVDFSDMNPRVVSGAVTFEMNPHGIDLWVHEDGSLRLFVVNHGRGSGFTQGVDDKTAAVQSVEIFDVLPDRDLRHVKTVTGKQLKSPNDVAAIGSTRFYVTNDHGAPPGLKRTVEDWLRLPFGNIVYYDGEQFSKVFDGTRYANGLATTADKKTLYMVETTGGILRRFAIDENGALTEVSSNDSVVGMDNLFVADDGVVWTAGHPKLLQFTAHAKNPATVRSPTSVMRFIPGPRGSWQVEEFYLNEGNPISGGSVAVTNGDIVVVGAVYDDTLMVLPAK